MNTNKTTLTYCATAILIVFVLSIATIEVNRNNREFEERMAQYGYELKPVERSSTDVYWTKSERTQTP